MTDRNRTTHSLYDLVIFDCDGVLVDSEHITAGVLSAMLNEQGVAVSVEDVYENFLGRSMDQCLEILRDKWHATVPADFVADYRARAAVALHAEVKPVPGIEAVIADLDIPYCVASNGTHDKMNTTLGITGLKESFAGKMYSVTDVARGKPAPDLFLYAAAQFGVAPGRCAVVEDTPTGVTAGVAAGMTVFGFCALTPVARLVAAGAQTTFSRMRDLPELLRGKSPRR